jgi:hypothetical protein
LIEKISEDVTHGRAIMLRIRVVRCALVSWLYPLRTALFATRSIPMSPTKLALAEAEIDLKCETTRKAGELAGMQQAMGELTALHRAYYGTAPVADQRKT